LDYRAVLHPYIEAAELAVALITEREMSLMDVAGPVPSCSYEDDKGKKQAFNFGVRSSILSYAKGVGAQYERDYQLAPTGVKKGDTYCNARASLFALAEKTGSGLDVVAVSDSAYQQKFKAIFTDSTVAQVFTAACTFAVGATKSCTLDSKLKEVLSAQGQTHASEAGCVAFSTLYAAILEGGGKDATKTGWSKMITLNSAKDDIVKTDPAVCA